MKEVMYKGPDLSYHNGNVNIKQIRDAGYERIGLRAGYGKNNTDQKYAVNAQACVNLKVPVMLYWFSYAYTEGMAEKEGQYAVEHAKKYWKKCPIAFDFEYDSINYARKKGVNITKETATEYAIAFLKVVRDSGYTPVLYTNKDYLNRYFDMKKITAEIGKVYVWYARYKNTIPESEINVADIWQFSSTYTVPGVAGKVDMNKFYTDFEDEKAPQKPTCNINILEFQKAANADGYLDQEGKKLVEDGIDGKRTQYVRKQINLRAKVKNSEWRVGSTGALVTWYQGRCNEVLDHEQAEDGMYGKISREETIELQNKFGLRIDGIAGYNTIQMLFYN